MNICRHAMTRLLATACLAGAACRAGAEVRTWNGPADGDWFVAGNWLPDDSCPQAGDAVVVPPGSSLLLTNETAALASFTITNATLTFSNWTACLRAGQVEVLSGGVLDHSPINTNDVPGITSRVHVVAGNLKVWTGGTIHANARGHRGGATTEPVRGQGPGGGAGQAGGRASGGSYGGRGGNTSLNSSGPTYGDHGHYLALQPGSGGGGGATTGGHGGGLIWLDAGDTVTVEGIISANGGSAGGGGGGGGASGGGITIRCQSLAMGTGGVIRANGGSAGNANGGRGGGGRIAILHVDADYFERLRTGQVLVTTGEASLTPPELASRITVSTGTAGADYNGTATSGTIYFITPRKARGMVLILRSKTHEAEPAVDIYAQITIPVVDVSGELDRQVMVAAGTETEWQGHPHTLLLPDGETMFCVWQGRRDGTGEHGALVGYMKRSNDGGLTWSDYLDLPANWLETGRGSPTIHRLVDAGGAARLFVFCRDEQRTTFLYGVSEDDGASWSELRPLEIAPPASSSIAGWTAPMSILPVAAPAGAVKQLMWYERNSSGQPLPGRIWQSASNDGGLTWGESRTVVTSPEAAEPSVVRSPDGQQLLMFIREAVGTDKPVRSYYAVSNDEGATWSAAQLLPLALTGDRHLARYAPDGRLVVAFRSRVSRNDPDSHFVAWVGRYEDIPAGREGQYRIKLLHSHAGWDHTYPGLDLLPDGTFVGTTYIKYRPDANLHSVVSVRFHLDELDPRASGSGQ